MVKPPLGESVITARRRVPGKCPTPGKENAKWGPGDIDFGHPGKYQKHVKWTFWKVQNGPLGRFQNNDRCTREARYTSGTYPVVKSKRGASTYTRTQEEKQSNTEEEEQRRKERKTERKRDRTTLEEGSPMYHQVEQRVPWGCVAGENEKKDTKTWAMIA